MQPFVMGIAGGSGSGKTTLARAVTNQAEWPVSSLAFDSYYRDQGHLTPKDRAKVNYDHPNSLDVERFTSDLRSLRSGNAIAAPIYDFATHTRSAEVQLIEPRPLIVVDGILLLVFPEIVEVLDVGVFVDVEEEVRIERRVRRDVAERGRTREHALAQINQTVRPMHGEFVEPSKAWATVVVDGTADATESAQDVLSRVGSSVAA